MYSVTNLLIYTFFKSRGKVKGMQCITNRKVQSADENHNIIVIRLAFDPKTPRLKTLFTISHHQRGTRSASMPLHKYYTFYTNIEAAPNLRIQPRRESNESTNR